MIKYVPEFLTKGLDKLIFIYELLDPETLKVRYVGQTNNIKKRYNSHIHSYKREKTPKANWIKKLKKKNKLPILRIVAVTNKTWADSSEELCISNINKEDKLNVRPGGNTSRGLKHSKKTKEKMSKSAKGKIRSKEHCENLSKSLKGKKPSKQCVEAHKEWRKKNKNRLPSNSCKIKCINNGKIYESMGRAARDLKLEISKISLVCNGHRKSTGGYSFVKIGAKDGI